MSFSAIELRTNLVKLRYCDENIHSKENSAINRQQFLVTEGTTSADACHVLSGSMRTIYIRAQSVVKIRMPGTGLRG
ncbi:hypothetical protein T09_7823 [Trichinella sp. T9]|nr:hypothetical protein T09_7823 [Trichinella sp. T9]